MKTKTPKTTKKPLPVEEECSEGPIPSPTTTTTKAKTDSTAASSAHKTIIIMSNRIKWIRIVMMSRRIIMILSSMILSKRCNMIRLISRYSKTIAMKKSMKSCFRTSIISKKCLFYPILQ